MKFQRIIVTGISATELQDNVSQPKLTLTPQSRTAFDTAFAGMGEQPFGMWGTPQALLSAAALMCQAVTGTMPRSIGEYQRWEKWTHKALDGSMLTMLQPGDAVELAQKGVLGATDLVVLRLDGHDRFNGHHYVRRLEQAGCGVIWQTAYRLSEFAEWEPFTAHTTVEVITVADQEKREAEQARFLEEEQRQQAIALLKQWCEQLEAVNFAHVSCVLANRVRQTRNEVRRTHEYRSASRSEIEALNVKLEALCHDIQRELDATQPIRETFKELLNLLRQIDQHTYISAIDYGFFWKLRELLDSRTVANYDFYAVEELFQWMGEAWEALAYIRDSDLYKQPDLSYVRSLAIKALAL